MTGAPDLTEQLIDSRHRVVTSLASDPLGDVYEVSALRLGRNASLKLYRVPKNPAAGALERFLVELDGFVRDTTLSGRVLDFGMHEGRPYVVFDPSGQVVSPEDAVPKIRTLVDAFTDRGASLPDLTVDAQLLASGPTPLVAEGKALPPPPPPPSKASPPTPPPPSFPPVKALAGAPPAEDTRTPSIDLDAWAAPPKEEPPPLGPAHKRLPKFDEIDIPQNPHIDSGTVRIAGDLPLHRTRGHHEPSFWQKHGGTMKGLFVALYLMSAAGAVWFYAYGLPNAARDARTLVRRGQTPQVIAQLEKYVTSPNPDPSLHAALGYAFVYAKKPHKALAQYRAAIEKNPNVIEDADVAAIRVLKKLHTEDAAEADALLKKLDALRGDRGRETAN